MIEFIVCDDNKIILTNVAKIIDKCMMKNDRPYKIYKFLDYNSSFFEVLEKPNSSKVYILDVETPSYSGIDIARIIRQNDLNSVIIFLTSHNEVGSVLLKEELMFLTFICKFDDYENRLESAIDKSIKVDESKKVIRFKDCSIIYTIKHNDILYITRDTLDRKSIIKTCNNEYRVNKPLNELLTLLSNDFTYSHRSCIVNKTRIEIIDRKKNQIIFNNGEKLELLSEYYVKGLM